MPAMRSRVSAARRPVRRTLNVLAALVVTLAIVSGWLAAAQVSAQALDNAAVMALAEATAQGFSAASPTRAEATATDLSALGMRVVTDLTAAGYEGAVIERDEENSFLSVARDLDVPVIFGDATLGQTLRSARVDRARLRPAGPRSATGRRRPRCRRRVCPGSRLYLSLQSRVWSTRSRRLAHLEVFIGEGLPV